MDAKVHVKIADVKRLFIKGMRGNAFNQKDMLPLIYRILDRVERDYPWLLENIYKNVSLRFTRQVAKDLKEQRKRNMRSIYGEDEE